MVQKEVTSSKGRKKTKKDVGSIESEKIVLCGEESDSMKESVQAISSFDNEQEELDLEKLRSNSDLVMDLYTTLLKSKKGLDTLQEEYLRLEKTDHDTIVKVLKQFQNNIGKVAELCRSTEFLLFRGGSDMSEYGLLNQITKSSSINSTLTTLSIRSDSHKTINKQRDFVCNHRDRLLGWCSSWLFQNKLRIGRRSVTLRLTI